MVEKDHGIFFFIKEEHTLYELRVGTCMSVNLLTLQDMLIQFFVVKPHNCMLIYMIASKNFELLKK